jgi:hypothetical protein
LTSFAVEKRFCGAWRHCCEQRHKSLMTRYILYVRRCPKAGYTFRCAPAWQVAVVVDPATAV